MFWDEVEYKDPIGDLLKDPNTTFDQVFNEPMMLQDLRCTNEKLMEFFIKNENTKQLCEWSMTLNSQENKSYDQLSRRATEAFACNPKFSALLSQSSTLQQFMNEFLDQKEWDNSCTGHFQRVFIELNTITNGEFMTRFPNFTNQILNHLDMLAVIELIISLIIDFSCNDLIMALSQLIAVQDHRAWAAAYCLKRALSEMPLERCHPLTNPEIVQNVEKGARNPSSRARIQILQLLVSLHDAGADTSAASVDSGPVNATKGLQLSCAVSKPEDAFNLLFKRPLHWNTANHLLKMLTDLGAVKLAKLVATQDGFERLKKAAQNDELSPQQIEVIRIIDTKYGKSEEWKSKIPAELKAAVELMTARYGGDVPQVVVNSDNLNAE